MIFVDTGAWFALAVRNDPDHGAALAWLRVNREALVTSDYVLAETATLLRVRDKTSRGHRVAVGVATSLYRRESAFLEKNTDGDIAAGLNIFRKFSDHSFSFVDCTSFAHAQRLGISEAFAFDRHFEHYPGLRRVPETL
ncbi:MAG: PIN domain-containing protein [Deltaproteobacteria bacterium]|nr:PIN domain-containing protein [Deltaproteobacteria bacterium]